MFAAVATTQGFSPAGQSWSPTRLGYSQQAIAAAKSGKLTAPLAVKIAEILRIEPGELLWIARTERERDPIVRKHLEAWGHQVGKMLASVPSKAVGAVGALTVALGLMFLPAHDGQAFGGAGVLRGASAGAASHVPSPALYPQLFG